MTQLPHSISSLLSSGPTKKKPLRPSPRFCPYSMPGVTRQSPECTASIPASYFTPSPSTYLTPAPLRHYLPEQHDATLRLPLDSRIVTSSVQPSIDIEEQLLMLKTLQYRLQPQVNCRRRSRAPRSKVITTKSHVVSSEADCNVFASEVVPFSKVALTSKVTPLYIEAPPSNLAPAHLCSITTCTNSDCRHKISPPVDLPRRQTKSADQVVPRHRTSLTSEQSECLQLAYSQEAYVSGDRKRQLSEETGLKKETIVIWFQNRRRLAKKKIANTPAASVN